jgi:hypothetical protein
MTEKPVIREIERGKRQAQRLCSSIPVIEEPEREAGTERLQPGEQQVLLVLGYLQPVSSGGWAEQRGQFFA